MMFDKLEEYWSTKEASVNLDSLNNVFPEDEDYKDVVSDILDHNLIVDSELNDEVVNEFVINRYLVSIYDEEEINNTIVISKDRKHLLIPIPVTE